MTGKTYLITGANRGIGRSLLEHYASQPHNTLIACVRDLATANPLLDLPRGPHTRILLAKIDAASRTDASLAIQTLQSQGVHHIDVVISSAGIAKLNSLETLPVEELEETLMINAISVLLLYKATLPLLRRAAQPARFAFISAAAGSLTDMGKYPYPNAAYSGSKALANSMVVKMGMENEGLITLAIHPGLVQTDLGNMGARAFGLEEAPVTLKACAENTAYIIDNATKEEHSEKFFNETIDRIHPW